MTADAESQEVANVEGTRHAVELAGALEAGCFHQVSSIAAAGLYQGELERGHVRRGRKARHPPLLPHQARVRAGRPRGVARGPGASTGRGSSSATRAPARSTRSTGPTTSSSCCSGRAGCCRRGCRRSGSKAARSTSSRSTTSPRRSTTSPTSRTSTARPSTSPTRTRRRAGEVINLFAKAADAPQATLRLDSDVTDPATSAGPRPALTLLAAGEAGHRRRRSASSASRAGVLTYVNYPTHFDSTKPQAALEGTGHRGAAAGELRRPGLGLLGAQPRPRPLQGPLAVRRGAAARSS